MNDTLIATIKDQTNRALWEVQNVICCVPDELWEKQYCGMPLFKHIYHMVHSLDQWYINPRVYEEPPLHVKDLNNLDAESNVMLSRTDIDAYWSNVKTKIEGYLESLTDDMLLTKPERCEWTRFTLIVAQIRHLHTHMGMIMGFIVAEVGQWPYVLGLTKDIPGREFGLFF